ncbi:MAG: right-handed parallel beta-helix repeat-containing protein [Methylotenera sp.]|nr:right-handed parallel beta-helix repeat-containing protein [Oligoflexia bacterium]
MKNQSLKIGRSSSIAFIMGLSGMLTTGCQLALNRSASVIQKKTITLGEVLPLYASAPQWNDFYVSNSVTSACLGTENNCKHGGELKQVAITGRDQCASTLVLTDALDAFNWACDSSAGKVIFKGSLKPEKSLADLVTPASEWAKNSVKINDGGDLMASTPSLVWWTNPVQSLPDSTATPVILSTAGTLYVAATNQVTQGYNINADKISIAFLPGVTLTGTATINTNNGTYKATAPNTKVMISVGTQNFNSVEGSNSWEFGVKPVSGWTLDGNSLVDRMIMFKSANYMRLKNLNLRKSAGWGMQNSNSLGYTLSRMNITDNPTYGLVENVSSYPTFDHINGMDNGYELVDFNSPSNLNAQWLYSRNTPNGGQADYNAGIWIGGCVSCIFRNIEVNSSSCAGMTVKSTSNSTFDQIKLTTSGSGGAVTCTAEGGTGLYYRYGSNNVFSNMQIHSNSGSGVRVNQAGTTLFKNIQVINNGTSSAFTGRAGIRETGGTSGVVTYQNVIASNNGLEGLSIGNTGSILSQILATHNGTSGVTINAAAKSVTAATVAFNGAYGINENFKDAGTVYHDILAYKNTLSGIYLNDESLGATLSQIVSQNNGGAGILVGTPTASGVAKVKLVGNLLVGSNTGGACALPAPAVMSGVADVNCTPSATSTATIRGPINITASMIEATSTTQAYASLTDWSSATPVAKVWGRLNPLASACITGENCQMYDWALKASDTLFRNTSGDAAAQNESFLTNSTCPAQTYGTRNDSNFASTTTFLRNAIEDVTAAAGNHNGLCEAGEVCIYTPNFGYYQGEGTLSNCIYKDNGGLLNIVMNGFSVNGH